MRNFLPRAALGAACLTLAGCMATTQTSSGADYLRSYDSAVSNAPEAMLAGDDAFRAAASVEPLLRFPAKIGLARIEGGRLTPVPDAEMDEWAALIEETGGAYGEFVPLNLLVAEMATPPARDGTPALAAMRKIRLGAARQHVDAVMVYEVFGRSGARQSALSVGDLTILGAYILPGRKVDAVGHAEAILVDVRNAYPYLTASETVSRDALATTARARGKGEEMADAAIVQAVADLVASLPPAMATLAVELGNLPAPGGAEESAEVASAD